VDLSRYRKAVTAVVGFVLSLLAAGVLPEEWAPWVSAAVAALTALGVYGVPNEPTRPPVA
jgi:hypothetical protein